MYTQLQQRDKYILTNYSDIYKANRLVLLLHMLDKNMPYDGLDENLLELMNTEIVPNITQSIIYIVKKHLQNIYWRLGIETDYDTIMYLSIERHIDILIALLTIYDTDDTTKNDVVKILDYDISDIDKVSRILTILDNDISELDVLELMVDVSTLLKTLSETILIDDTDEVISETVSNHKLYNDIQTILLSNNIQQSSSLLSDILSDSNDILTISDSSSKFITNIINKIKYYSKDGRNITSFIIDLLIVNYITKNDYLTETGYMLKDFTTDETVSELLSVIDNIFKDTLYPYIDKYKERTND